MQARKPGDDFAGLNIGQYGGFKRGCKRMVQCQSASMMSVTIAP